LDEKRAGEGGGEWLKEDRIRLWLRLRLKLRLRLRLRFR
jgi:hypothetical protein